MLNSKLPAFLSSLILQLLENLPVATRGRVDQEDWPHPPLSPLLPNSQLHSLGPPTLPSASSSSSRSRQRSAHLSELDCSFKIPGALSRHQFTGYRLVRHGWGCPGGSDSKESTCNVGDLSSIPGLGRSPGGGHGNPLQPSCLENPQGQRNLMGCSP